MGDRSPCLVHGSDPNIFITGVFCSFYKGMREYIEIVPILTSTFILPARTNIFVTLFPYDKELVALFYGFYLVLLSCCRCSNSKRKFI